MIINHKYKFIFIHVPKCAGTSIKRALYPYCDEYDQFFGGHPNVPEENSEVHKHSTASEVKRFATRERWDKYFTFSFVRNPFSRIVSLYKWWQETDGLFDIKTKNIISNMSFEEFVFSKYTGETQVKFLASKNPKKTFVTEANRVELDFLGKHERINKDFAYVCGLLKLPNLNLEKHNVTTNDYNSFNAYYNKKTKTRVREKFAEDFDFLGY
tara:strand:+ start:18695 stop:19330 length:636 start_codon:yes stop_codon:yes gene_type:complete